MMGPLDGTGTAPAPLITGIINTWQEAANIRTAIASLRGWCDEIIVVDQYSPDGTAAIAEAEGARVISCERTGFVEAARRIGIEAAAGGWVLALDADELVHPALGPELRRIASEGAVDVVRIPRRNIILGRWMRHGQWWPNAKPRFFRKEALVVRDQIHAGLVPAPGARVIELPARPEMALWHYSYHSLEDLVEKTNRYTSVEARQAHDKARRRAGPRRMIKASAQVLWREYIREQGFRDGTAGLAVAVTRAYYRFLAIAKTWDDAAAQDRLAAYEASKRALLGLPPAPDQADRDADPPRPASGA
jgi:glycosyltransferase involved in cell wall biosynthesis